MYRMMGFGDFMGDDPFFGHTMRQMDNMMNSMLSDPFGMMGAMGPMSNMLRHNHAPTQEISPFNRSPFGNMFPFPNINSMFPDMRTIGNDPNAHSFSSSTVMTMVNGPDGRPQVYQASSSTRSAPGGVKETKKSVVDTRTGTKKMAIGHHIGERAHIMEREQNTSTGEIEGRDNLINLDLDEKDNFEQEWHEKTRTGNALYNGRHRDRAAIQNTHGSALPSLPPAGTSHSSSTTANLRAKARAAVVARRKSKSQSFSTRVEITEITDDDDTALTNSPSGSSSPIIEYPSHSQSQQDHDHGHGHHDHVRRSRSRELRDREREGSRKRDLSDETEDYRHKYKSRRSRQH